MHRTTISGALGKIMIRAHWAIQNGGFSGHPGPPATFGNLPSRYCVAASEATYVVYAGFTPIAWVGPDGAPFIPDYTYNVRVAQYQKVCARAFQIKFRDYDPEEHTA